MIAKIREPSPDMAIELPGSPLLLDDIAEEFQLAPEFVEE